MRTLVEYRFRAQSRAERRRGRHRTPCLAVSRRERDPRPDPGSSGRSSTPASRTRTRRCGSARRSSCSASRFSLLYIFRRALGPRHDRRSRCRRIPRPRRASDLFLVLGEQHHRTSPRRARRATWLIDPGARPVHRHGHRRRHRLGQDLGLHVSVRRATPRVSRAAIRRGSSAAWSWK